MAEKTDVEVNKKSIPEYDNNRSKLVIEIGHGGPSTISSILIRDYLKELDANYLGVDVNPETHRSLQSFEPKFPEMKSLLADVTKISGLDDTADEVWVRNYPKLGVDEKVDKEFFSKTKELLKKDGKIVFVNSYDGFNIADATRLAEEMKNVGFEIQEITDTMETSSDRFVEAYREDPTIADYSIVVIVIKAEKKAA